MDPEKHKRVRHSQWTGIPCSTQWQVFISCKVSCRLLTFCTIDSTTKSDEKPESTTVIIPPETPKLASLEVVGQVNNLLLSQISSQSTLIPKINSFVATSALPNLRKILVENDKIISACNNIIYYIVNPAMRNKTRCGEKYLLVLVY
jgi:hypothetical protein